MQSYFDSLDSAHEQGGIVLKSWAEINTFSGNIPGLTEMEHVLCDAFSVLEPDEMGVFHGGIHMRKRAEKPFQIFLGGHFDTVFSPALQFETRIEGDRLRGPGVCDMKGGLFILLKALEAFENSPFAAHVGWEVVLNNDEEIGSPRSRKMLEECAERCQLALLFEPCLPDGALVSSRMGSAHYTVQAHGVAAHVGRDPERGASALFPLAEFVAAAGKLHRPEEGRIVNVGGIEGGGPANIIPDFAEARLNVRAKTVEEMGMLERELEEAAELFHVELLRTSFRPPKPFSKKTEAVMNVLKACGKELGLELSWRPTGGACDGNFFAALGVPTIDTLGPRGGGLHTLEEYVELPSLAERVQLASRFLIQLGEQHAND